MVIGVTLPRLQLTIAFIPIISNIYIDVPRSPHYRLRRSSYVITPIPPPKNYFDLGRPGSGRYRARWVFVSVHRRLIGSSSINLLPDFTRLGVLSDALADGQVVGWLLDSLIVATGTTVLSIALGVPLGYALSRFAFRGKAAGGKRYCSLRCCPRPCWWFRCSPSSGDSTC